MSGHNRGFPHKKSLTHGWIVVPSKTYPDRVYFYNTVTRCSTWKNPCEDTSDRAPERSKSLSPQRRLNQIRSTSPQERSRKFCKSPCDSPDSEIEDYDEENDHYFEKMFCVSPANSNSLSLKTSASDSDSPMHNSLLENGDKELWLRFLSSQPKTPVRKSLALSDMDEASTSIRVLGREAEEESKRKFQLPQSFNQGNASGCNDGSVSRNKKNKSKSKKESDLKNESPKEGIEGKTIKNVCFKIKDKTPAQTRLLKLRKQNAERLKELANKHPEMFSVMKEPEKAKKTTAFDSKGQSGSEKYVDFHLKSSETFNNNIEEFGSFPGDDFNEEMDWEPSSEENDVRNINVFRQQLDRGNDSSSEISFGFQSDHSLPLPSTNRWFVALDTNIFVSCLNFVKELRDVTVPNLGCPVIYVPWRVLQELDHLKDPKINAMDKNLPVNVRKAIAYLNENFKSGHPRVIGQSFEDFRRLNYSETSAPDDEILQTCIQFQKENPDKKLMLLTNDKNLQSKAIISGIEAHSKDKFQKKYLSNASTCTAVKPAPAKPAFSNPTPANRLAEVDNCVCEVKSILKEFLPLVVETELKIAFEGDWVRLAFKKPPWNLQDALDCMLKHWRSVFFVVFSKEAQLEVQKLYERLFKKEAENLDEIVEIIKIIQRLFLSIRRSQQKKKRAYMEPAEVAMEKLSNLLNLLSSNHPSAPQIEIRGTPLLPSLPAQDAPFCPAASQVDNQNDVERVKNLFKDIWDSLRSFCCTISDVVYSSGASATSDLHGLKLKMSQVVAEVTELVLITEKIFETNPTEIHENHPLITHFGSFLIRVYPAMELGLQRELPKCLVAFFNDFEGRTLLSSSLNDFREFSSDLICATEYFNTQLTG